jgi:hypothetical protein
MPAYTIAKHQHRFAAWAASTAARRGKYCHFKVRKGVKILEACGFDAAFSLINLPKPADIDATHREWRKSVISAAKKQKLHFTHGVAAKLLNCYLKVRFVCGGHHNHKQVRCLHPPIDRELLRELASKNFGNEAKKWRVFRDAGWSKFGSAKYESVISLIRRKLSSDKTLWKIEEHWPGYQ